MNHEQGPSFDTARIGPEVVSVIHPGGGYGARKPRGPFSHVSSIGTALSYRAARSGGRPGCLPNRTVTPWYSYCLAYQDEKMRRIKQGDADEIALAFAYLAGLKEFYAAQARCAEYHQDYAKLKERDREPPPPPPGADPMTLSQHRNNVQTAPVLGRTPNNVQSTNVLQTHGALPASSRPKEDVVYQSVDGESYTVPRGSSAATLLLHAVVEEAKGGSALSVFQSAKLQLRDAKGKVIFDAAQLPAEGGDEDVAGASFG